MGRHISARMLDTSTLKAWPTGTPPHKCTCCTVCSAQRRQRNAERQQDVACRAERLLPKGGGKPALHLAVAPVHNLVCPQHLHTRDIPRRTHEMRIMGRHHGGIRVRFSVQPPKGRVSIYGGENRTLPKINKQNQENKHNTHTHTQTHQAHIHAHTRTHTFTLPTASLLTHSLAGNVTARHVRAAALSTSGPRAWWPSPARWQSSPSCAASTPSSRFTPRNLVRPLLRRARSTCTACARRAVHKGNAVQCSCGLLHRRPPASFARVRSRTY